LKNKLEPFLPASLTLDNGMEFANGIIRRFLPKHYRETVTDSMVDFVQNTINNTPRKILCFKTPHEVFCNRCTSG